MLWSHSSVVHKMISSSMTIRLKRRTFNEKMMFIFSSIFPADVNISERQTQAFANAIRVNGTNLLQHGRSLFLWKNVTSSILVNFIRIDFLIELNDFLFSLV